MLMAWAVVAFMLFLFRPSSLRSRGDGKPTNGNNNNNGGNNGNNDQPPPAVM
jgi:hypothetical protein